MPSFIKEFGLILFVYSIGIQVGPGFFSAFRAGGLKLNLIAAGSIAVSVITTIVIHLITKLPISTMVGILYGAVTNTPGLGAAQQTYTDITGTNAPEIAMGYAVAYPLGVVGAILTLLLLRYLTRINPKEEEEAATKISGSGSRQEVVRAVALVTEDKGNGKKISWLTEQLDSKFIISRIRPANSDEAVLADGETVLHTGDKVLIVAGKNDLPEIFSLLGEESDYEWNITEHNLISRQILIVAESDLRVVKLAEPILTQDCEAKTINIPTTEETKAQ